MALNNNNSNINNNNTNDTTSSIAAKQGNLVVRGDQNYDENLQALFDSVLKPNNSMRPLQLPFRMRKLPNSFFNPPSTGSKSSSVSHSRANSTDSAFSTGSQNGASNNSQPPPITTPQLPTGRIGGLQIIHSRAHSSPASLQQTFAGLNTQNNVTSAVTVNNNNNNNNNSNTTSTVNTVNNNNNESSQSTDSTAQQQAPQPIHIKQRSYDVVSAIQLQNELGDLPPGWEQARTPEGQIYYLNHITKTTQWEDPRTQLVQQHTLAQLQQALTQSAISNTPIKETATNNTLGVLPEGWEQAVTSTGEAYFINHINRTTSWFDPRISDFLVQRSSTIQSRPEINASNKWDNIRILEKEREYLKQRQQEIQHQDLLTRQNQQTMGLQMDPFLSGITDHTRQESGDSGLSLSSNNFSVTPDFLPNIDDSMDCLSESGNLDSLNGLDSADNLISSLQLGNNLCSEMLNDVQNLINTPTTKPDNSVWYKLQD